ncbi:MAG: hypothetical protein HPY74_03655 [Firmicutes bacterium]|nr:hypothetical protein [Bacillota bacterium]
MVDVNSRDFPQKVDKQSSTIPNHQTFSSNLKSPAFFKEGENVVFIRPFTVNSHTADKNRINLTCETKGFLHKAV